jgi:hypothetical protein
MFANTGMAGAATSCPLPAHFIGYAIHRTRLPEVVVFTALFLLARLKECFPAARGSSSHCLFISAFMIASKVVCEDTYSNKSWCIVGQNLYTLKEVNQMEREMCSYLEWILHVGAAELETFTECVRKEWSGLPSHAPAVGIYHGCTTSSRCRFCFCSCSDYCGGIRNLTRLDCGRFSHASCTTIPYLIAVLFILR